VELMVVVAIIGILAAIAVPRFRVFQAKARQAEAKMNLASIATLEQAYQAENDTYVAMTNAQACLTTGNPLGFYINCGSTTGGSGPRYQYTVTTGSGTIMDTFSATASSLSGSANRVAPGCKADVWTMDEKQNLSATNNSVTNC